MISFSKRAAKILAATLGIALAAFAAAAVLSGSPSDPALWPPKDGEPTIQAILVNNGFHTGVIFPRAALAETAARDGDSAAADVAERFASYDYLEFGWGEEQFYRETRTLASLQVSLALRALFWPGTDSVVHVFGMTGDPDIPFAKEDRLEVRLSQKGFDRIVKKLDATFKHEMGERIADLGAGLYGPSLFYPANGAFGLVSNCNRWAGGLIAAGGLPSNPVLALFPQTLFAYLRWRTR